MEDAKLVVLVSGGCLLLISYGVIIHLCYKYAVRHEEEGGFSLAVLRNNFCKVRDVLFPPPSDDPIDVLTGKVLDEQVVKRVQTAALCWVCFQCMAIPVRLAQILNGTSYQLYGLVVQLFLSVVACTICAFPQLASGKVANVVLVALFIRFGTNLYHYAKDPLSQYEYYMMNAIHRILTTLVHGCPTWCIPLCAALHLGTCILHPRLEVVFIEVYVFMIISVFVVYLDFHRRAVVRARLQAKQSSSVEETADGILSIMCDVVVHLASDLTISRSSPSLAAFLLRSVQGVSMTGDSFTELLDGPDNKRSFSELVGRPNGRAKSMPVTLRDAASTKLKAQLIHVRGSDLEDATVHVVGLREDQDTMVQVNPSTAPSQSASSQPTPVVIGRTEDQQMIDQPVAQGSTWPGDDELIETEASSSSADRRRTRATCHGTPAQHQGEELPSRSGVRLPSRETRCMLVGFRETSASAMAESLLAAATCWNVQMTRTQCCSFHAVTAAAKHVAKWLHNKRCHDIRPLCSSSQCEQCGILTMVDEHLDLHGGAWMCDTCKDAAGSTS